MHRNKCVSYKNNVVSKHNMFLSDKFKLCVILILKTIHYRTLYVRIEKTIRIKKIRININKIKFGNCPKNNIINNLSHSIFI